MHNRSRGPVRFIVVGAVLLGGFAIAAPPALGDAGDVYFSPPMTQSDPTLPLENASYPRTILLQHSGSSNGTLIATSEDFYKRPNGFEIRRSTDGGASWTTIAFVTSTGNEYPLTWHPTLFEVPEATGDLDPGDLLLAGAAFPPDDANPPHSIEIYKSTDHGVTWSHLATPVSASAGVGVWEPDFELDSQGRLVLYYANEVGFTNGGQSLNHVISTDGGSTWSSPTIDIGSTSSAERPGMPTVTRVGSVWIMNIEGYCNGVTSSRCRPNSRNWVKTSYDGVSWGDPLDWGSPIETADGRYLAGTPYTTWTPAGGPNGTLLATGHEVYTASNQANLAAESGKVLFANYNLGKGPWYQIAAPIQFEPTKLGTTETYCVGWSSALQPTDSSGNLLMLAPVEQQQDQCQIRFGTASAAALPYADPFDDSRDPGWASYGGSWAAASGVYSNSSSGSGDKAVVGSTGWSDYKVSTGIRLDAGTGNAGVVARVSNAAVGADAFTGYYVGISDADALFLGRMEDSWTTLASTSVSGGITTSTWYSLSLELVGCDIRARLLTESGLELGEIDFSDSGCTDTRLGQAGVRTFENPASFKDFTVQPVAQHEAELAATMSAIIYAATAASGGAYVGGIDDASSYVAFSDIWVPQSGTYSIVVRYANGGAASTHDIDVNGVAAGSIDYVNTGGWGQFAVTSTTLTLSAGNNTVKFRKGTNYAELDYIKVAPRYEAEYATIDDAVRYSGLYASNLTYVGGIDHTSSRVEFTRVEAPASGTYPLRIWYANGGSAAAHQLSVNGGTPVTVNYPSTAGWGHFEAATVNVYLNEGPNSLAFTKGVNYAEIDAVDVIAP